MILSPIGVKITSGRARSLILSPRSLIFSKSEAPRRRFPLQPLSVRMIFSGRVLYLILIPVRNLWVHADSESVPIHSTMVRSSTVRFQVFLGHRPGYCTRGVPLIVPLNNRW